MSEIEDRVATVEKELIAIEYRQLNIVKNLIRYGFTTDNKDKQKSAWLALLNYFIRRQVIVFSVTIISVVTALSSLYLAYNANSILKDQNTLIINQNKLVKEQGFLLEADRRSSLNFLIASMYDIVNEDLDEEQSGGIDLSMRTVKTISAVCESIQPYRRLGVSDSLLTSPLSPERGQLLVFLTSLDMSESTYDSIYKYCNFAYADIEGASLPSVYLSRIHMPYSNCKDVNFLEADLSHANLAHANFDNATLNYTYTRKTNLFGAQLKGAYVDKEWLNNYARYSEANIVGEHNGRDVYEVMVFVDEKGHLRYDNTQLIISINSIMASYQVVQTSNAKFQFGDSDYEKYVLDYSR